MILTKTLTNENNIIYNKYNNFYVEKKTCDGNELVFKKIIVFDRDRICVKTYKDFCDDNSLYCDNYNSKAYGRYIEYMNGERWGFFIKYIKNLMLFNKNIFNDILINERRFYEHKTEIKNYNVTINNVSDFEKYFESKYWNFSIANYNIYLYITKDCLRFEFNEFKYGNEFVTKSTVKMFPNENIKIV